MRVLLTTSLVRTGQWRHVCDLIDRLHLFGFEPVVAIRLRKRHRPSKIRKKLRSYVSVPQTVYREVDELVAFARRHCAALIHAHSSRTYRTALWTSCRLSIPLVLTLHGSVPWLDRFPVTMARASAIIAVGPAQAGDLQERYPEKVSIIPNGVDVDRFRPHREGPPMDAPLRVLWYGRTSGLLTRGVEALDKAIGQLRQQGHPIEGRLVGIAKGATVRHLKNVGWLDDPLPHLHWSHVAFGHGRSLREAMACGNVGFLLGYGYGGLVRRTWFADSEYIFGALPEYDLPAPEASRLARDILNLHRDRKRLHHLRQEARLIAEKVFDRDVMVRRTAQIYVNVLGQGNTWQSAESP